MWPSRAKESTCKLCMCNDYAHRTLSLFSCYIWPHAKVHNMLMPRIRRHIKIWWKSSYAQCPWLRVSHTYTAQWRGVKALPEESSSHLCSRGIGKEMQGTHTVFWPKMNMNAPLIVILCDRVCTYSMWYYFTCCKCRALAQKKSSNSSPRLRDMCQQSEKSWKIQDSSTTNNILVDVQYMYICAYTCS